VRKAAVAAHRGDRLAGLQDQKGGIHGAADSTTGWGAGQERQGAQLY